MSAPDWKAQVAPELAPLLKQLPNLTFGPFTSGFIRLVQGLIPVPAIPEDVEHRVVRVGKGDVHIYRPKEGVPVGAVLWIHGGGRVIGTPKFSASTCIRLAQTHRVVVAATSYRKAPKHPFPAALDDCHETWMWLLDSAREFGYAADKILLAGESAGGGLAAELTQRIHDEGGVQPTGQVLVYPMLDDRTATRDDLTARKHLVWNNGSNRYGWSSYLGQRIGRPEVPQYAAAARREDLTGLPPAWMTVGTLDLFHDEDLEYAERLRSAGVDAELHVIPGGFHGYFGLGREEPQIVAMWKGLDSFLTDRFADPR